MLGVSIITFATPACLGYAIHAYRSGTAPRYSLTALCLAVIFAVPVAFVLIVGAFMNIAAAFL
jgi:hypothetical protein